MTGLVTDIQKYSVHDGPGMRTNVFLKGCLLRCRWCCNPEAMLIKNVLMYDPKRCIGCGACAGVCPTGAAKDMGLDRELCTGCGKCEEICYAEARYLKVREMTSEEVVEEVLKDKIFYDRTGGGVTFSGGEAAYQIDFLEETLKLCKEKGINTAIETCGCMPWKNYERILPYLDVILYDIKSTDSRVHREFTGTGCETIMENCAKMAAAGKEMVIRVPVVPGFNFDKKSLEDIVRFAEGTGVRTVNFLPYHRYAENKYELMGMEYWDPGVESLSHDQVYEIVSAIKTDLKLLVNG